MQVPDICEVEKYQPLNNFKLIGKVTFLWWLSEIGTLLWKFVSKIDALVLFISALIKMTYLRIPIFL